MKTIKRSFKWIMSVTIAALFLIPTGCEKQSPVSPLQSGAKIQTTDFSKSPGPGSSFFSGDSSLFQTNSRYGIGDGF